MLANIESGSAILPVLVVTGGARVYYLVVELPGGAWRPRVPITGRLYDECPALPFPGVN